MRIQSKSLSYWSKAYLQVSLSYRHREPTPSNCGIANEKLASLALVAVLDNDESAVQRLCSHLPKLLVSHTAGTSCEWLYGYSGLLYLLRLCRCFVPQTSQHIDRAAQDVVNCILNHPQPWKWHGKEYLGAVHGTIGIITQLVLSFHSQQVLDKLSPALANLLRTQFPSGNFPSSSHSSHSDVLVQFCHGAPGFILALRSVLPYFPHLQQEIISAIEKAQKCVMERGVLIKSPCLCHGLYGNALSLPRCDMLKFLKLSCQGGIEWDDEEDPDDRFGLFTGEGGRSWAMAIAAKQKEGMVLGFNGI